MNECSNKVVIAVWVLQASFVSQLQIKDVGIVIEDDFRTRTVKNDKISETLARELSLDALSNNCGLELIVLLLRHDPLQDSKQPTLLVSSIAVQCLSNKTVTTK
jgi:hypothetical protein